MPKTHCLRLFPVVSLILVASLQGTKVTTALIVSNEVVFVIPVGDQGIHYADNNNPDRFTWGPSAFTIAPDGTFWIADTVDNHLLRFSPKGEMLDKIAIHDFIVGAGDLEVTDSQIWILDIASMIPKVVQLSLDGMVMSTYDLPEGLRLRDGLSGIALGNDGSLLIEQEGGMGITRLLSHTGALEQRTLSGYEAHGKVYSFHPGKLRSTSERSHGTIQVENKQIDVDVSNDLGSLSILRINNDGSFLVEVDEMVINPTIQLDQKVYRYDSEGNLIEMARVPLANQYVPVSHGIAIGPDGEVYALITRPDSAEVQRLNFSADLPPNLIPSLEREEIEQSIVKMETLDDCRSRDEMIDAGITYLDSLTYLTAYHIDADGSDCSYRPAYDVPRYHQGRVNTVVYLMRGG